MNRTRIIGATGTIGRQVPLAIDGCGCASPRARAQPERGLFAATGCEENS
jgi:hypothetical protein